MHTIRTIDIDRHKQRLMYYMPTYIDRICENMCLPVPTSKQAISRHEKNTIKKLNEGGIWRWLKFFLRSNNNKHCSNITNERWQSIRNKNDGTLTRPEKQSRKSCGWSFNHPSAYLLSREAKKTTKKLTNENADPGAAVSLPGFGFLTLWVGPQRVHRVHRVGSRVERYS